MRTTALSFSELFEIANNAIDCQVLLLANNETTFREKSRRNIGNPNWRIHDTRTFHNIGGNLVIKNIKEIDIWTTNYHFHIEITRDNETTFSANIIILKYKRMVAFYEGESESFNESEIEILENEGYRMIYPHRFEVELELVTN